MHLYLSTSNPWNANYCTESGQIMYKVESEGPKFGARRMMISKIAPSNYNPHAEKVEDAALRDEFVHLGEVEYHTFRNSRIKYGGQDLSVRDFFRKAGWACFGRNRIFTGPDGREYCWKLTTRVCKLFVNGTETPVACYHRHRIGILKDARPASLEIFPDGEKLVDLIVVTFVYMEKLRKDKERASKNHGGGGGP